MAALKPADALSRARDILNDAGVVRWPNSTLLRFLNDFLNSLWALRADAQFDDSTGAHKTFGLATISGETVPTDDLWADGRWAEHGGLFIAASALEMDGAEQADAARAVRLWRRYTELMEKR